MVQKSQGSRHGTRKKLKKERKKKSSPITKAVEKYEKGDIVHIDIDPSIHKGMPHPRFDGRTAKIREKRGKSYIIEVTDKSDKKELAIRPEHLKPQEE
ncbi:50S ribosomal protein L21e [archaeon SCG-AAA382B04]|nr:50S ribosomal protein L21e [archaeon SCG-AAA382B04]